MSLKYETKSDGSFIKRGYAINKKSGKGIIIAIIIVLYIAADVLMNIYLFPQLTESLQERYINAEHLFSYIRSRAFQTSAFQKCLCRGQE